MGVDNRTDLGPGREDVAVETPFRGGRQRMVVAAVEIHRHEIVRGEILRRDAGGRDEEAAVHAHGDVARGALAEAEIEQAAHGPGDRLAGRECGHRDVSLGRRSAIRRRTCVGTDPFRRGWSGNPERIIIF